jgi:osmotically-inducible protein OsmY
MNDFPNAYGHYRGGEPVSDEAIRSNIEAHLQHGSHYRHDIVVEVDRGVVTLLGDVPHSQMKHEIEEMAASSPGVVRVNNKLNVLLVSAWPEPHSGER